MTCGQRPIFVYGTLRPGRGNHTRLVRGRTAAEEPALLRGAVLYRGPGFPYAVPVEPGADGGGIRGDLLWPRAAEHAALLTALDELEGYTPGASDNHYERVPRVASRADGSAVETWVYLASEPVARRLRATGSRVPGDQWPPSADVLGAR
ncbi:gamma-glutamylcyclotransferase family protein [Streptomyces sp. TP-A0874]|uniref:gamma-glutamylcyclotransferase family protein n=1 Tax=Streptomyces sp. TP-A0874 TaxID=549819 RepID=UPI00085374FD|nr:gamma-glutamylcyclotransferase family protein [Streptomyces sp. TP-A0874]